jgi:DNA-binding transcriptional regulator PaaX
MDTAGVQSVIIEDLIHIGEEYGFDRGRLASSRAAVGRVLSRRGLAVTAEQQAQIDGCEDLATLERWHDLAITAPSADDALR